jgi:hypothetical protein
MSIRSTESIVSFKNAFLLSKLDSELPAGTYRIVRDDEEIAGLSFLAYRRIATMLHTPSLETSSSAREVIDVDSDELEAAISADH